MYYRDTMLRRATSLSSIALAGTVAGLTPSVTFGQRVAGPGLVGLPYANAVEEAAARANQAVFDQLEPSCNPNGIFDNTPAPPTSSPGRVGVCTSDDVFFVYVNSRELVHSGNELQGQGGPTVSSLHVDQENLGTALRWTAAEEFAAQGSMATDFANGQLSNLAARMTALRFGATGFGTARLYSIQRELPLYAQEGGAAPADAPREEYSPWGGFLNASFGYGEKVPTPLEDAFAFDGSELTLGVDYRLGNNLVVGGIFGFSEQVVDFDESASAISVVDGQVDSDGDSFMVFAMLQGERLNINGSLGTQSVSYDVSRHIKYPSFNADTSSVYSIANSTPETSVSTATFGVGYAFTWGRVTMEPFFSAEYVDATVDAFAEQRSINLISNSAVSRRFDLSISEQQIESFEASLGFRFQYVVTPRFGVIVPYLNLAAHSELENDARIISAQYAALQGIPGFAPFSVPTDAPDDSYVTASTGFSMIVRGGRQRQADGPVTGGVSMFLQLTAVESLENYEDRVITGGIRYEF